MKRALALFLLPFTSLHGTVLFLNSTPMGAEVFTLSEGRKKQTLTRLGKTPLRLEFSTNTRLLISKEGFASQTNTYRPGAEILDERILMTPLSFTVNFPADQGFILVNGIRYTSLDGSLILPYGSYEAGYNKRQQTFALNAKSPYTPYLGFFTALVIASLGVTIAGAVAEPYYQDQFNRATTFDSAVNSLMMATAMRNVMWTGVGIGTGSLIGMSIFAHYEAKERRRIKRFNSRNLTYDPPSDLADFNEILAQPTASEDRLSSFVRRYAALDSPYLPQVYLMRARLYIASKKYNEALRDLTTIETQYPTLEIYETAARLRGEILTLRQNYLGAYQTYKTLLPVSLSYQDTAKKMLQALSRAAAKDQKLRTLLTQEISGVGGDKRFTDKAFFGTLQTP